MNSLTVKNTFTLRSKRLSKEIRLAIMREMARGFDNIRRNAFQVYMIPNLMGRERRLNILRIKQKTHPTKLTSRTRALEKMLLLNVGKWRYGSKTADSKSSAVNIRIRTTEQNSNTTEMQGIMRIDTANVDVESFSIKKRLTSQQLIARFFWDRPSGIRGKRRPFIAPAAIDERHFLISRIQGAIDSIH